MKIVEKDLSYAVMGAAIEVHRTIGPGLMESIYHECLSRELDLRGIPHENQVPVPLVYKGVDLSKTYQADIVVKGTLVLELKAVAELLPVHDAQLLTYMKLLRASVGYVLNFNVKNLTRDGSRRLVL